MSNQLINAAIGILSRPTFQINEELTDRQKRHADKMTENGHGYYMSNFITTHAHPDTYNKFQYDKDTGRKVIRIPVSLDTSNHTPSDEVHDFLKSKGYHIKDNESYSKGLAHKEIITGNPDKGIPYTSKLQSYKIGGLLKQHDAPEHIIKKFVNDPARTGAKNSEYDLVVANHPHDIYGISTNRGWTSCSNMETGGVAAKKMPEEINNYTHVVYLTKRGGNYDTDAIARLKFSHHTGIGTGHQTLISERRVYGDAPTSFRTVAEQHMKELFPIKDDIYLKNSNIYSDSGDVLHSENQANIKPEHIDKAWKELNNENKVRLYSMISTDGKYKSRKLQQVQKALATIKSPPTGDFVKDMDSLKYSTYDLDDDQKRYGIEQNKNFPYDHLRSTVAEHMKNFDINNNDHVLAIRSFTTYNPLRNHLYAGIESNIKPIKTVQDFDTANKIHKIFGNRDYQALEVDPNHELGHDPIKTLGNAGVLHGASDYHKAYFSLNKHSKMNENWFGMTHRLARENIPNAHLALDKATRDFKNSMDNDRGLPDEDENGNYIHGSRISFKDWMKKKLPSDAFAHFMNESGNGDKIEGQ